LSAFAGIEQEVTEDQRTRLKAELGRIDEGIFNELDEHDISALVFNGYHTQKRLMAATKDLLLQYLRPGTVELLWEKLHPGVFTMLNTMSKHL
jgi:hypothetical protein